MDIRVSRQCLKMAVIWSSLTTLMYKDKVDGMNKNGWQIIINGEHWLMEDYVHVSLDGD